jgi:hypothetical protein
MSRTAALFLVWGIAIFIIGVGLSAVALTLVFHLTWSLATGGLISGFLGVLWLLAWVVYYLWA